MQANALKLQKGTLGLEFFHSEGCETAQQVAQRGDRCSIPGNIHSQARQGFEQSNLIEVPVHGREAGLGDLFNPNHSRILPPPG